MRAYFGCRLRRRLYDFRRAMDPGRPTYLLFHYLPPPIEEVHMDIAGCETTLRHDFELMKRQIGCSCDL